MLNTMTSIQSNTSDETAVGGGGSDGGGILSAARLARLSDIMIIIRYIAMTLAFPAILINVIVFMQKDMRSATSVYVIGISLAQLFYVITVALQSIFYDTFYEPLNDYFYWVFNLYFGSFGVSMARRGCYLATCLLSMERLYAIARPLHVKAFFLSRRPVVCVASAFFLSAALHTYILAKSTVVEVKDGTGRVVYKPASTSLYLQHKHINDTISLAVKCLLSYAALCAQIVLNVLTIWFLKRHNVSQRSMTSSGADDVKARRERQMTVTVLAATVCYVALSLPWALHNFVYTIAPKVYSMAGTYRNLYIILAFFALNLTLFSCGIDFIWFMTLSSSYKRAFCRIFRIKSRDSRGTDKVIPKTELSES